MILVVADMIPETVNETETLKREFSESIWDLNGHLNCISGPGPLDI